MSNDNSNGSRLTAQDALVRLTEELRPFQIDAQRDGVRPMAPAASPPAPGTVRTKNHVPRKLRRAYTYPEAAALIGTSASWIGRYVMRARLDVVARYWVRPGLFSETGLNALRYEHQRALRLR